MRASSILTDITKSHPKDNKHYCSLHFNVMERSVLVENKPILNFTQNYIQDSSGISHILTVSSHRGYWCCQFTLFLFCLCTTLLPMITTWDAIGRPHLKCSGIVLWFLQSFFLSEKPTYSWFHLAVSCAPRSCMDCTAAARGAIDSILLVWPCWAASLLYLQWQLATWQLLLLLLKNKIHFFKPCTYREKM